MIDDILLIITMIVYEYIVVRFALKGIHMFQQNRYEITRFYQWQKSNVTKTYPLAIMISWLLIIISLFIIPHREIQIFIMLTILVIFTINMANKNKYKTYIKPLVYTNRVKRQLFTYGIISVLFLIGEYFLVGNYFKIFIVLLALFHLYQMHLISLVSLINNPLETIFKNRFLRQAKTKLNNIPSLSKIGITGSYGKTSSKNIIYEILSKKYYCLVTPASYNTPQGISITINNNLQPIHDIFICEMGADKVGDISELFHFVEPQIGIVTSIGEQHLGTFKTQENIINEKMKMVELMNEDGLVILNKDEPYISNYPIKSRAKQIWYGIENEADYQALNINYSKDGSNFDVLINDELVHFETRLLGIHNIYNILAGIAIGLHYHISIKELIIAIKQLEYTPHRLEVKKQKDYTIIDNAFNSNPVSSKKTLDVLAKMPGLRICITPGLIDLGTKQDYYNKEFGLYFKDRCDRIILVGRNQTKAIYEGLVESGYNMKYVYIVNRIFDAFNTLERIKQPDCYVLLENDLPDAFNN
ncbi:MAG: UDP-N-acetylmuramoyl-tripeptide--D-alanyl-D-alanine ligase [Bacilli bacterium]|jgi:UDP-N-acetylmuramoyl-tripeptide--D-alanyl-D-alanine ligase|nr:UDP-N-acetylmuramoyl-tripeptide--D-alanyl-D-alanine ligase [Bacilli bacterium]